MANGATDPATGTPVPKRWTAEQISDQSGRTFLVTGANSGLGLVTARELARRGAHVIMAVRNEDKGRQARDAILAAQPDASLELRRVDLADLDSVQALAEGVKADGVRIDVLVNNAGIMMPPRSLSPQGHEGQFAANHLGHFALTGLLLGSLGGDDPRVVTVSSMLHRMGRINFDDLNRRAQVLADGRLRAVEVRQRAVRAGARPPAAGRGLAGAQPAGAPGLRLDQPADQRADRVPQLVHADGQRAVRPDDGDGGAAPAVRRDRAAGAKRRVLRPEWWSPGLPGPHPAGRVGA